MELPLVLRIQGSDLSLESTKEDDAKESQEIKRQERNQFDRPLGIGTSLSSLRLAVKGKVLMSK